MYYKATTFLWDTFTYFNYFFLFGIPVGYSVFSFKFKKRLVLRCIHHFESDWINSMNHMRISGTEPSSVTLSQTM